MSGSSAVCELFRDACWCASGGCHSQSTHRVAALSQFASGSTRARCLVEARSRRDHAYHRVGSLPRSPTCRCFRGKVVDAAPVLDNPIVMMPVSTLGRVPRLIDSVRETTARGAGLYYLPPYSPNLKPIEPFFSAGKCRHELDGCHERQAPERLVNVTGKQLH